MRQALRRRGVRLLVISGLVLALAVGGFGVYLASLTGSLPWQVDPTRIAITPFAGIPGFGPSPTAATDAVAPQPAASQRTPTPASNLVAHHV